MSEPDSTHTGSTVDDLRTAIDNLHTQLNPHQPLVAPPTVHTTRSIPDVGGSFLLARCACGLGWWTRRVDQVGVRVLSDAMTEHNCR